MTRMWCMGAPPSMTGGALMPGMPVTPRATTYRTVRIYGQPGTQGIRAPRPEGIVPVSQNPRTQGSNCAPDVIFPSLYYTTPDNMHAPVSLFRDNQMPVPAVGNFGGVGRIAPTAFKRRESGHGGQTPIDWPALLQRFPSRAGLRGPANSGK
jgi:hypothetical protein